MFRTSKIIINQIEAYLSQVDESAVIFQNAMPDFLNANESTFSSHLNPMSAVEHLADDLKRKIENALYTHSLLPESRGDILRIIERLDELIDTAKEILVNFEIEKPYIPEIYHAEFIELVEIASKSVKESVESAKIYFRKPSMIKNQISEIYRLEKQADVISNKLKREIFCNENLHLSQKAHIRYFIVRTDLLADKAESVADLLSISAIKLIV